ncbi:YbdD/YjiX family protein [Nigerium sp.]|jgi:uncharacterized short protein YbdD (DUF466 family)|uniref:YbdD/YjiX family protein n=1 Tax=Nigerium sp. TaxID=2042655 RepID=UPI00322145DF
MRALLPRVAAALRSASWIADGVLGAHGYQNYLAHQRVHGHGEPPLTEREFWKAEYARQGRQASGRCC